MQVQTERSERKSGTGGVSATVGPRNAEEGRPGGAGGSPRTARKREGRQSPCSLIFSPASWTLSPTLRAASFAVSVALSVASLALSAASSIPCLTLSLISGMTGLLNVERTGNELRSRSSKRTAPRSTSCKCHAKECREELTARSVWRLLGGRELAEDGEVELHRLAQAKFQGVGNQGVADGHLVKEWDGLEEWRHVVAVEIVPGVDSQAEATGATRRAGVPRQDVLEVPAGVGDGVGLGVQLDPVGAQPRGPFDLLGQRVHEQADPAAAVVQLLENRLEALGVGLLVAQQVPALVAGEGVGAVGDEGALCGSSLADQVEVAVEGVALDVEFGRGVRAQELGDLEDILRADVPLVGARVDGDALRPGVEGQPRGVDDAGDAVGPCVPQGGDLVDVHAQPGHGRFSSRAKQLASARAAVSMRRMRGP